MKQDDCKHVVEFSGLLQARTDLITRRDPHPLVAKLFGWHIGTATAFRGWTFTVCWTVF